MDDDLRENLYLLAETIVPLRRWLAGTPGQRANVLAPWREHFVTQLSVRDVGVIEFLDRRIADSGADDAAARRWQAIERDPLKIANGLKKGAKWRAQRKLGDAQFGLVKSANVEVILDNVPSKDGKSKVARASSRREFYGLAFPAFMSAVNKHAWRDWEELRDRLLNNDPDLGWPKNCLVTSAQFVHQFAKDVLYGLMGMFDQPAKPETTALLAELGQHRRKGNSYSVEDAAAAVAALRLRLG